MKRGVKVWVLPLFLALSIIISFTYAVALDYPHNSINNIGCNSCHFVYGSQPSLLPPWTAHTPVDIDDTQYNTLCWSCHNDIDAPYVRTHSSLQTDNSYGDWTVECRVCHNPHYQRQFRAYGSASYLYSGVSTDVTTTTITKTGAGWTVDAYAGLVVVPNVSQVNYNYKIVSNTSETLTVQGPMDLTKVSVGDTFAIVYGQLIKDVITLDDITNPTPPKTGDKTVRFFNATGAKSFSDGDGTYDGICEVCHTQTTHFRNDGTGSDQLHANMGSVIGADCTQCHSHVYGFAHGTGGGTNCGDCHGHDPGYGGVTGGAGTYSTHSTHTENDADDLRGPNVGCNTCHDTSNFPYFKSGTDSNGDGKYVLSETDVCDTCHSPGGTYDGVNDSVIGAKNNWQNGVYSGSSLVSGKEKWCAGCHDEVPSVIQSISAPNVIGDEDGTYTYGTGWGFYKTGHGLSSSSSYPASGGVTAGAGKHCLDCHDSTLSHIDGNARTFDCSNGCDSTEYRQSYRLSLVGGQDPMLVPWPQNYSNDTTRYRLCMSCHSSGPFVNSSDTNTNLKTDGVNRHEYHLRMNELRYPADYNYGGTYNSRITCVVCHNVHGSTRLAMVRDGKLIGREPGLRIWYNNDSIVSYNSTNPTPPDPENLPLSASTGTLWIGSSSGNLCTHCHNNGNTVPEYRTPFQNVEQVPTLDWTGETYYQTDGVYPDSAAGGSSFEFRVKYADANNDAPVFIELWVDKNDDGDYNDTGEKLTMTEVDAADTNYIDGKIYKVITTLSHPTDSVLNYRFYASDGASATGAPTTDQTVTVTNNPPTLAWTGESNYEYDGVNPNSATGGSSFEFRIKYTDINNDAPSVIEVWVDENDNGSYDSGEKYAMTEVNSSDTDYTDGKLYTKSLTISYAGDGSLNYRFYASDASDAATGSPTSGSTVSITSGINHAPTLIWTGDTGYSCDGVNPDQGPAGTYFGSKFVFQVKYADADDDPPSVIQVWLDKNDDGDYNDVGEKETMNEVDTNDTNYVDGKLYTKTIAPVYAGDGTLSYRFYASDGTDSASGGPTSDKTISLTSAINVAKSGGYDYTTIGDAYTNVSSGGTILVAAGTYSENLDVRKVVTIQSVDGASSTTITASGSRAISFNSGAGASTLNGFTITGGNGVTGAGVYINQSQPTIINCIITGNDAGSSADGGGIYVTNASSTVTISNTTVSSNSARNGGGIFLNTGVTATITNCTIDGNSASNVGGGIDFNSVSASTTVIGTTISNNTSAVFGGGVYLNGSPLTFNRCIIKDNTATSDGGGIFLNGSSSTPTFTNCIISGNQAGRGGAAFGNTSTSPTFTNCSIVNNTATQYGGVFYINAATIVARNTILWGNTADTSGHISYFNNGSLTIADSIAVQGGKYNGGNSTPTYQGYTSDADPLLDSNYHLTSGSASAIDHASATYAPADDIDGDVRPQGSGDDIGADEYVSSNNTPTLAWTGETNYTSDGVNPDSAVGGSSFEFRIEYTDADNTAPTSIQVWVDIDDSGTYECNEKYDMTEVNSSDTDYTDGKLYTKTLTIYYAGDGSINYRFYASDGTDNATGTPISNKTVTITNNTPTLAWTGETNYVSDGVDPDSAAGGSSFEFRIDYTDTDNTAPTSIQVWVDEDDSGTYDVSEKYDMTEVNSADTDYTDGKRYTKTLTISYAGDGTLNYRFYASDGTDTATGTPTSDSTITLTPPVNSAPTLAWTGETNYTSDGVNPDSGAGNFEFRIKYTDTDNDAPSAIQVWVDEDDSGTYDVSEKYDMTEVNSADTDYTDGKLYTKTLALTYVGDGILNYRFYASDGTDSATGTPTSDSTVTVVDPLEVPAEYATIQAAINAASNGDVVLVSDGTYSENINYNGKNITVQSVNGAAVTTIQGSGANAAVVTFNSGETSSAVLDGFTIDNQAASSATRGIYIAGATPTIRNSIIQDNYADNSTGGGGGVYIDNSAPSFDNVTIRANYAANRSGCGMYITGAAGGATITNSTIGGTTSGDGNNCTNGKGGGIYYTGSTTGTLSISNSNIQYNQSATDGAGLYLINITNTTTIANTTILNNTAGSAGNGGGIYANNAQLSISDSTISSNVAGMYRNGGGIYLYSASATITNSTINSNSAGIGSGGCGGGISVSTSSSLSLTGSNVRGNSATTGGGGICIGGSPAGSATVINSVIAGNRNINNWKYGGGIANWGTLNLYFSTVTDNYAYYGGGLNAAGTENIYNSIIWGNVAPGGGTEIYSTAETLYLTETSSNTSFVSRSTASQSVATTDGDYHLQSTSNCIDTADATNAPSDDIEGNTRPTDIAGKGDGVDDYDKGAYEYQSP